MIEQNHYATCLDMNTKDRKEWATSVDELFSELLADALLFDQDMKLRFVEAFFYAGQKDIRQAMADFDTLGDADRLVAGYFLRSLASKARAAGFDRKPAFSDYPSASRTRVRRPKARKLAQPV